MFKRLLIPVALLLLLLVVGCVDKGTEASGSSDISDIELKIATIEEQLASSGGYADIIDYTTELLTLSVCGSGNYPVVVTILGSGLDDQLVNRLEGAIGYYVSGEYLPCGTVLYVVVSPSPSWQGCQTVSLDISALCEKGIIDYITVQIGA